MAPTNHASEQDIYWEYMKLINEIFVIDPCLGKNETWSGNDSTCTNKKASAIAAIQ